MVTAKSGVQCTQAAHGREPEKNKRVEVSKDRPGATDFYASRLGRPDVTHPIVMVHPATGRKALYLSQRFTIGIADMPEQEADELLDLLFEHQLKMDFQYHHKWHDNDVVMWDNRCLLHRAGGGYQYPEIRLLHKTVVAGDKPH